MKKNKKDFVEIFEKKAACNVSAACKMFGISRRTFYNWYEKDEEFRQEIDDSNESITDMVETQLLKNIREGKENSIIFYLKTKGKNRGYGEQIDAKVEVNSFEAFLKQLPD